MINYIYLTVLFPLLGFLINGLFGAKIKNKKIVGIIGSSTIGLSFLVALGAFIQALSLPVDQRSNIVNIFTWISVGGLHVQYAFLVDQLSLVMALIVTGVGFLIHIYSIGYMHNERGYWRFFAYMNLFIFAMMNLVLGDNFLVLFFGWEGVGLCSYLLIGFYYDRKFEKGTVSQAAKKAFIANRVGDFGFLLGMFLIYATFHSLNYLNVFHQAEFAPISKSTFDFIALFLFIGATGKSAQIPLHIWLPDAMAGPTPVSALIHAATMVTAGVYMVARTSILFASAPAIMTLVAVVGLLTAFFAATIAIVQNDIKKVLAYSTISQLGYMFLALGVGAFAAGIFHLMTHAFFKALLFLGAGSIIHSLGGIQDMRKFGGLKKYMPITFLTYIAASLAISGFPPFSGFFSKDEILGYSYTNGNFVYWLIGAITALLTAFYIFRIVYLTFYGEEKFGKEHHPHESPSVMTIPLIVLGILSVIGGFIGIPAIFSGENGNLFQNWLSPVFEPAKTKLAQFAESSHTQELLLMTISVILAIAGIYLAYYIYTKRQDIAEKFATTFKGLYTTLLNKYYVDEFYESTIIKPIKNGSEKYLWKITDVKIIDGFVNGVAVLVEKVSGVFKKIQNGFVQSYAMVMLIGIMLALFWIILSL